MYLRVSTARQAEKDLSIPDQRRQLERYCEQNGWSVVADYVEPGASATSDQRPAFQRMIDDATSPDQPFDVVLVHSYSRFFRDAYQFEFFRRRLEKASVSVVSISQQLGDDPMAQMLRQMLNLFDEYQSKENAKHVLRAMKENARQGFWNGSRPPYGYRTYVVETRGDTAKKRLQIDESEAGIVQQIFEVYLGGNGVRAVADRLNGKGLRYRRGRLFGVSLVHAILTRTAYKGEHVFNKKCSKTKRTKDPSEWVMFETPTVIEPEQFDRVQALLEKRRPSQTPPRVVNGPTLLTGLAKCGDCGGGMTLRTGKGGRYRYYTCNTRATEGTSGCKGRNIPMGTLDAIILEQLENRLFKPNRLKALLATLMDRNRSHLEGLQEQAKTFRKELRATEEKIGRLYDALADGTVENTDGFKSSLGRLDQRREDLLRQVSQLDRRRDMPSLKLTQGHLKRFAEAARAKLHDPDSKFRKDYVRLFVDRVEVDDAEIRIFGSKSALAGAALGMTEPDTDPVPSSVPKWWAQQDSNLQPDRYERPALTS
ncbi:Putative site-specific recombinase and resolvase superfamily protein [Magnetospira sp. QH-2]|nr:Putative site-specific recombinase and resolvase superfamily protein [Magnetospira sp. QH-2]